MTGARRIPRSNAKADLSCGDDQGGGVVNTPAPLPTHCAIPDIPVFSELVFQVLLLLFSLLVLVFQLINLYNTVWWIPYSNHEYAVEWYGIDVDLMTLIILVLSHRLLVLTLNKAFERFILENKLIILAKYSVYGLYYFTMSGTFYLVFLTYPLLNSVFLLVPVLFYLILFGPSCPMFIQKYFWKESPQDKYDLLIPPPTERTSRTVFHACSTVPEQIRREVYLLRTDFNYRLRLVYYESLMTVFYAAVVPFVFCRATLHMNIGWVVSYIILAGLTTAAVCFVHRVPAQYMDTLHRSAVHLGSWQKVEGRGVANVPHSVFSELTVWPKGIIVKHMKGLFKAEGINNVAEPGNAMHSKFYVFFNSPEKLCGALAILCSTLGFVQFLMLLTFSFWFQLLSMAALMLTNYFPLFRSVRDYLILNRVYREEKNKYE